MDDELELLDAELVTTQVRVGVLEDEIEALLTGWEETYPGEELTRALEIISLLTDKVLSLCPDDLEVQYLYEEAEGLITPRLRDTGLTQVQ